MKKFSNQREDIRDKIIGLGKDSIHKSYFPELQKHISELEQKKKAVEEKNKELIQALVQLRKTQAELSKSEQRFRTLFEHANDAIFIHDTDFKLIDCNQTAEKLFQIPRERLIGKLPDVFSPKYQPNGLPSKVFAEEKLRIALNDELQVFEWTMKDKENKPIHSIVSLKSFTMQGKKYIQAIVRDITHIKKLENELVTATIRTEENERARFAKELHDGVGPVLSTIKLYFQWLAETEEPEQRKVIIEKGNQNILEAINALKEVSNNLSPHILTNYGLVEGLAQFIRRINDTKAIQIKFKNNVSNRFDKEIETTLYRVITELVNNTLKHADATKINIALTQEERLLSVRFKDNGKGFSLKEINSNDAGLGLSNIRNRIQNLGGFLDIKSEPGKGTKTIIKIHQELPFKDE